MLTEAPWGWMSPVGAVGAGKRLAALGRHAWKLFCESSGMDRMASGAFCESACPSHSAWM